MRSSCRHPSDALHLFALLGALALAGCGDDAAGAGGSASISTGAAGGPGAGGGTGSGGGEGGAGGAGGSVGVPLPEVLLAEVPTQSVEVASMAHARAGHTATLLPDGTVLVIGGEDLLADRAPLPTVERYDPASDVWTELPALPEGRHNHTATLLGDGTVLVVGGGRSNAIGSPSGLDVVSTALVLDPATGAAEVLPGPAAPRHGHQAVRLPSGKVLLVGGADDDSVELPSQGAGNLQPFGHPLASAEIFDPETRTFSPTGATLEPRSSFVLVGLADGRALVSGGITDVEAAISSLTNEVFDEATGAFVAVGELDGDDRLHHAGTLLEGGAALLYGGKKSNVRFLEDAQRFDPATGAFAHLADAEPPRTVANVAPLVGGGALVLGGLTCSPSGCDTPRETVVVGADGSTTAGPSLVRGRATATATVLPDGSVLVVGGYQNASLARVERLTP